MITLITGTGIEFDLQWIGIANLDGCLRFGIINQDNLSYIFQVFTNPENCRVLTRFFDEDEQTFEGYTVFRGVTVNYDGTMVVSLSKI